MFKTISLLDLDLKDALDLAILVEIEAKERYEEFARQIGSNAKDDAGSFFQQMARNETKHAEDLKSKRNELFGDAVSRMSAEKLYEYQEIEAPEFERAESFMSPHKALKVALESEIKAFNFFNKAEKEVKDPAVKELFRELKEEELEHKKMVETMLSKVKGDDSPLVDPNDVDEPSGL